jgi:trehalose/maltose hydrolase-like predicted phosphorylase
LGQPLNPPPHTGPRDGELPAYVGNGLVGLRVREVPLVPGLAIVSGVAGEHPERRIEAAAPVPYPLAGDIALNGVRLSDQPWAVADLGQEYDFGTAELTSRFSFTVKDRSARIVTTTFASRTEAALVLQELRVEVDGPCELILEARVETAHLRGRIARRRTHTPGEDEPACDGSLLWRPDGDLSSCGVALHSELIGPEAERSVSNWDLEGPLATLYKLQARPARPIVLRQIAALMPSVVHQRPDEEAVRRVGRGKKDGFEAVRDRNREAWRELWEGRIVVHGASEKHQALIDAAFFYLNASVHPASPSATSIFGLATWHDYHYYYGHVMWDVDAFCVPPLILFQPKAAGAVLAFRTHGRGAAGSNAHLSGCDGLKYPWEAGPVTAQEATPGDGAGASHEDHGSLHVARAFSLYADITGDRANLAEDGWPVLEGVANWIASRVVSTQCGFEMHRAMGPAETPEPPDNDAFTLMASRDVLRRAIRAAESLGHAVPETWREVEANLYLPRRDDGAIASHDGFRINEPKGQTPSPLAGLFPCDYPATATERENTLALFLTHWRDYVGAPMLPCLYPVWAAMAGDRALALELFEEGYAAYDHPRFHQCLEYRLDHGDSAVPAGPFFANLGGMLLGLVYGFAGLVIDDGDPRLWPRRPVVLPKGWREIEIGRIWVRGRPARLSARHGAERAELSYDG